MLSIGILNPTAAADVPDGDLAPLGARDGNVNVADALIALRYALRLIQPVPATDLVHGDVAPMAAGNVSNPDGAITIADALLILRKALKLVTWTYGSTNINGGGTKGPLAGAVVSIYRVDTAAPGFKGNLVASAATNDAAAITGLALPFPITPPYLMEFTSTPGTTTDITTGRYPVIDTLRTVLTQTLLDSGVQLYATPLTTMATNLAIRNANSATAPFTGNQDGGTSVAEFLAALPVAARQIAATVGFGIDKRVDIFATPPLIDASTNDTAKQQATAAYRKAVEALTAVIYQMQQRSVAGSTAVLDELTDDLADGNIDGNVNGSPSQILRPDTLAVLDQDPETLPIPEAPNNQKVGDVEQILHTEKATTGATTDTTGLGNGSITVQSRPAINNPDLDGDGTPNNLDAFPHDPNEDTDTDGDGVGDNADNDDDGDGVNDANDVFPLDPGEHRDTDGDGVGNNADTDDDNDGVLDINDDYPLDAARSSITDQDGDGWPADQDPDDGDNANPGTPFIDTDGDGIGDSTDDDDDGDGVADGDDAFPLDPTESIDTDKDGTGDNADDDDDGDGTPDVSDPFPLNANEDTDTDGDGIGNNTDTDDDGDGISDIDEGTAGTNPLLADSDGDGRRDGSDAFPLDPSETTDTDKDGIGDNADTDDDDDGVSDADELSQGTKPLLADTDGDGIQDGADAFPLVRSPLAPIMSQVPDITFTQGSILHLNDPTANLDLYVTDGDSAAADIRFRIVNATDIATGFGLSIGMQGTGFQLRSDDSIHSHPVNTTGAVTVTVQAMDQGGNLSNTVSFTLRIAPDDDGDGIADATDNCPVVSNPNQHDADGDGLGDVCDPDNDNDGINDGLDNCPLISNFDQQNNDADALGDACDNDDDNDTVVDDIDNCPLIANTDQHDNDGDAQGDACDDDDDNDGIADAADNCPLIANPDQADADTDGIGDLCDSTNDGGAAVWDNFNWDDGSKWQ